MVDESYHITLIYEFKTLETNTQVQWQREVTCAVYLAKLLDQRNDYDTEKEFANLIETEAKELASTPFGATLLAVIGYIYDEQANIRLGIASAAVETVRQQGHMFMNTFRMLRSGAKTYSAVMKMSKDEEGKSSPKENGRADEQHCASTDFIDYRDVVECECVLISENITHSTLTKDLLESVARSKLYKITSSLRAQSLKLVGTIFQKMGLSTDDGLKAISEKMKAQFEQESEMRKAAEAAEKKKSVLEMKRKLESNGVSTRACLEARDVEEYLFTTER